MKYVSVRKNKASACLVATLIVFALSSFAISRIDLWAKSMFELLMLIFLMAAIQISQRYLFSGYEYILDREDELTSYNRITVVRTVGKNRTSVFTLPLSSVSYVIPYKKARKIQKEYGRIGAKISFCPDIFPKESYQLVFENNDRLTLTRIECDSAFASEIEKRLGI